MIRVARFSGPLSFYEEEGRNRTMELLKQRIRKDGTVKGNDVLKVDGNMAIAWSGSLDFTVERSGKTLLGSAASGEGLVNVYRGTGKVLLAPVRDGAV